VKGIKQTNISREFPCLLSCLNAVAPFDPGTIELFLLILPNP